MRSAIRATASRTLVGLNRIAMSSTRRRVLALYKELHRLGRDYPDPNYDFNARMRRMFEKNRSLTDPAEIEQALHFGEYIKNETLALYSLRKYRYLKQRYDSTAGGDS